MSDLDAMTLAYGSDPEKYAHLWPQIQAEIDREKAESRRLSKVVEKTGHTMLTRSQRFAESAKLLKRAIRYLRAATATAPEGECHNLAAIIEPHLEAMERGANQPCDGSLTLTPIPLD